jgi:hypothetical protein
MTAWIDAGREHRHAHPWLAEFVFALDALLRHRNQVIEFSTNPACVFRLNLSRAEQPFRLADDTQVRRGDRIMHLHLWNEQIPPVPPAGPTLSWARTLCRALAFSLCELAQYVGAHRDLDDIAAVGANLAQGTREQRAQLTGIMRRFGFAPPADSAAGDSDAMLRRLGENILISFMVLAQNPVVLRADTLWRDRTPLFISRAGLLDRYGERRGASSSVANLA